MTSPARASNMCVAMELPISSTGSPELGQAATAGLDRFFRGSPLEMEWPRHAMADQEVIFLIVVPYGEMQGLTQNERLTRARAEAIRRNILRYQDRWNLTPGRLQTVELRYSRLFLDRAGVRRDPGRRHDAYVLIDYPADRLLAGIAAGTSPAYCGDVFRR